VTGARTDCMSWSPPREEQSVSQGSQGTDGLLPRAVIAQEGNMSGGTDIIFYRFSVLR
jgi:hypothetical protein